METAVAPITAWLKDWRDGNDRAIDKLMPCIYGELRRIARNQLWRDSASCTLQPTALVHDAYLQLAGARAIDWESRSHLFGIASRLMRQILIQKARARNAGKRGGEWQRIGLEDAEPVAAARSHATVDLDDALNDLAREDLRKAMIVELHYFDGMTNQEIGAALAVSVSTVERDLRMALAWLRRRLRHM